MNDTEFRAWMDEVDLTQQAAADLLEVARMSVSRWAKGERPVPDEIVAKIEALRGAPVPVVAIEPAKPPGRITEHAPGHIANSTPIPHVGDRVRVAPPHGGPWMQVRWIEGGVYNCWWEQDGTRYADDYSLDQLETLYADRTAAGVEWPPRGGIVAIPISTFKASKPVSKPQRDGVYRFGILYAE